MTKAELHERIISAFADVPYPGDDNLGVPEGRDDSESVQRFFKGRTWQSLMPAELWGSALHFMTPQAFHYYLPAYLLAWGNEEAGDAPDAIFWNLTPPELDVSGVKSAFFETNLRDFTSVQKRVISEFLNFVHEEVIRWYSDLGGLDENCDSSLLLLRAYWSSF